MLSGDGQHTHYDTLLVSEVETFVDTVDSVVLTELLILITSPSSAKDEVNAALDRCAETFKKFREEYASKIYPMVTNVVASIVGVAVLEAQIGSVKVTTQDSEGGKKQ